MIKSRIDEAEIQRFLKKSGSLKFLPPDSIQGHVDLKSQEGEFLHRFHLLIQVPVEFPFCFPRVWETGGDIPRIDDRHVFPNTENLCLGIKAEERILWSGGITFEWFFNRVLIPRLADEYCVMCGGDYYQEYSHGTKGDWEFYFKELRSTDKDFIIYMLLLLKYSSLPKEVDNCPCNSGLDYGHCHAEAMQRVTSSFNKETRGFWENQLNRLILSKKWLE